MFAPSSHKGGKSAASGLYSTASCAAGRLTLLAAAALRESGSTSSSEESVADAAALVKSFCSSVESTPARILRNLGKREMWKLRHDV